MLAQVSQSLYFNELFHLFRSKNVQIQKEFSNSLKGFKSLVKLRVIVFLHFLAGPVAAVIFVFTFEHLGEGALAFDTYHLIL